MLIHFNAVVNLAQQRVEGELDSEEGYKLSWIGDLPNNEVTFTVEVSGLKGIYILGFSKTKNYVSAHV